MRIRSSSWQPTMKVLGLALLIALTASPKAGEALDVVGPRTQSCSLFVGRVVKLDDAGTRYAIALFTHSGTDRFSGTIGLYSGEERYDVHFDGATAVDPREPAVPTPLVVRFDQAAVIEGAAVTAIDGTTCVPVAEPWRPGAPVTGRIGSLIFGRRQPAPLAAVPSNPDASSWSRFLAAAAAAPLLSVAPPVAEEPVACSRPAVAATTEYAAGGRDAANAVRTSGQADVLVTIGRGGVVQSARIERPSGSAAIDSAALDAAGASRFRPAIFRCRPYGGSYIFSVLFE